MSWTNMSNKVSAVKSALNIKTININHKKHMS